MGGAETAAAIAVVGGVATVGLGIWHAHYGNGPIPFIPTNGDWIGWTDAKAFDTYGGHYVNVGSVILWGLGAVLLLLGHLVPWAYLLGLVLIALGITIYLVQFPYG